MNDASYRKKKDIPEAQHKYHDKELNRMLFLADLRAASG
jgi:hypothetical protein